MRSSIPCPWTTRISAGIDYGGWWCWWWRISSYWQRWYSLKSTSGWVIQVSSLAFLPISKVYPAQPTISERKMEESPSRFNFCSLLILIDFMAYQKIHTYTQVISRNPIVWTQRITLSSFYTIATCWFLSVKRRHWFWILALAQVLIPSKWSLKQQRSLGNRSRRWIPPSSGDWNWFSSYATEVCSFELRVRHRRFEHATRQL